MNSTNHTILKVVFRKNEAVILVSGILVYTTKWLFREGIRRNSWWETGMHDARYCPNSWFRCL